MLTYNHAPYIEESLSSVLGQDFDGPWEIIVADDASPDGTAGLATAVAAQSDNVQVLPTATNLGMQANLRRALSAARGGYIALLEGDDYWTDNSKLRRQIEYLDSRPSCMAVAHLTSMTGVGVSQGELYSARLVGRTTLSFADVAAGTMPHASSLVYRRVALPTTPQWFDQLQAADWSISGLLAAQSDIGVIPRVMSNYRKNESSTWTPRPALERRQLHLQGLELFSREAAGVGAGLDQHIAEAHAQVAALALRDRRIGLVLRHSWASLRRTPTPVLRRLRPQVSSRRAR